MSGSEVAGWYPDPYDEAVERWWDGRGWVGGARPRSRAPRSRSITPVPAGDQLPAPAPKRAAFWPVVTAAAGVGLVVGSFLPWTTLTGTFGEHASIAGTSRGGDGWWSLLLGAAVIVAGLGSLTRPRRTATALADAAALGAVVVMSHAFFHLASGHDVLGPSNSIGIWDVSVGTGLTLATVAAVVSLLGAAGITGRHARAERGAQSAGRTDL